MNKQILTIIAFLLVITFVGGAIISIPIENATFTLTNKTISEKTYDGTFTANCDYKTNINMGEISETGIEEDEINKVISKFCIGEATNIRIDGELIKYKDGFYGYEIEVKKKFCYQNWTGSECEELPIIEEIEILKLNTQYYCLDKSEYQDCNYGISGGIGTRCYKTSEKVSWFYCSDGWKLV